MPVVRGCNLPDDLLYDVENHIWFREVGDGTVKLGMTTVATALAGEIVAFTPKKAGRAVQSGKSCATIESGKWVGPAKSVAAGEIAEVNEALVSKPNIANQDPYDAGWMVIIKPEDWASAKATLTPGTDVGPSYEAKMDKDGFSRAAGPLNGKNMKSACATDLQPAISFEDMQANAANATILLKSMANETRLLILCQLAHGERSVSELLDIIPLGQSALSQHLAILRRERLVATRREGQSVFYALSSTEVRAIIGTLYQLFCDCGEPAA